MRLNFLGLAASLMLGLFQPVFSAQVSKSFLEMRKALVGSIQPVEQKEIMVEAETKGHGYKAANLQLLTQFIDIINVNFKPYTKYSFVVPEFVSFSSGQIQNFLEAKGIDISKRWSAVVQEVFPDESSRSAVFKSQQFPPEFFAKLATLLVEPIKHLFESSSEENEANLGFFQQIDTPLRDSFEKLLAQSDRCMVRSSGREDTAELANAGGNETVANVKPVSLDIGRAMGIVVASYFGEKSLLQRLGAGDKTVFQTPMTPVIVQRMVGVASDSSEDIESISRCGVMFTEEPEGGLSGLTDYKETSGISVIQSSYGHNEGVVNSIVPVDTYYTTSFGNWFPVIRPKVFRLNPGLTSGQLVRKENPRDLQRVPVLSREEVFLLTLFSSGLEQFYQRPMDVEFVVDRKLKSIAIVQARPIVHPTEKAKPSYLVTVPEGAFSGEIIGSAGGSVRVISSKDSYIGAKTIGEALSIYQQPGFKRSLIECIVIGTHAPSTSHEATTFRSEGKPVIFFPQYDQLGKILEQGESVLVDTQRGLFAPYKDKLKTFEDLFSKGIVVSGWVQYPIPALLSLVPRGHLLSLKKHASMVEGLLLMANKRYVEEELARLALLSTKQAERQILLLRRFDFALNYQQPGDEIVNGFSLALFGKSQLAAKRAKAVIGDMPFDDYTIEYLKLADYAMNPDLAQKWKEFVLNDLAKASVKKQKQFLELFAWIGRAGVLETWLHAIFAQAKGLDDLLVEYQDLDRAFIQALLHYQSLIAGSNLEGLGDPKKFLKVWEGFTTSIVDYFLSEKFHTAFISSGSTSHIIALSVMQKLVELFDAGLKIMSRSPLYRVVKEPLAKNIPQRIQKDRDKGAAFIVMLRKYFVLLESWWGLYNDISVAITKNESPENWRRGKDLKVLESALEKALLGTRQKDFESSGFDATRCLVGYREFCEVGPKSLEDVFTAIHQNLLSLLSYISKVVIGDAFLPEELQALHQLILKLNRASLVGFSFGGGAIHLFYNWPQMVHSAFIQLRWTPKKKALISLHFYGIRNDRWKSLGELAALFSLKNELMLEDTKVFTYGLELSWFVNPSDIEEVSRLLNVLLAMSDESHMPERPEVFAKESVPLKYWLNYPDMGSEQYNEEMVKSADTKTLVDLRNKLLFDAEFQKRSIDRFDQASAQKSNVAHTISTLWAEEAQRNAGVYGDIFSFAQEHLLGEALFLRKVAYTLLKDAIKKGVPGAQDALLQSLIFWKPLEKYQFSSAFMFQAVDQLSLENFLQYVSSIWDQRETLKIEKDIVFVNAVVASFVKRSMSEQQRAKTFDVLRRLLKWFDSPKSTNNLAETYYALIHYLNSGTNTWFFTSSNLMDEFLEDALIVAKKGSFLTVRKNTQKLWRELFALLKKLEPIKQQGIVKAYVTLLPAYELKSFLPAFKTFAGVFSAFWEVIKEEKERSMALDTIGGAIAAAFETAKAQQVNPELFKILEIVVQGEDKASQAFVLKMLSLWADSKDKAHQGAFLEFFEMVLNLESFESLSQEMQKVLLSLLLSYFEQDWFVSSLSYSVIPDYLDRIEESGVGDTLGFVDLGDRIKSLKASLAQIKENEDSGSDASDEDDFSYLDSDKE